jgi:sterol desaturase/sphingolipid hydroxylase (fatty acid hydroxylase superfamily)
MMSTTNREKQNQSREQEFRTLLNALGGETVIESENLSAREPSRTPWAVMWLTWPATLIASVGGTLHAIKHHYSYSVAYPVFLITAIVVLVMLEFAFPADWRWQMTWQSFGRDLKYLLTGSVAIAAINGAYGWISIQLGTGHIGPLTNLPLYVSVPVTLLVVDFLQYWQHRWSHELSGPFGRFLWRTHVAHHLPDGVYVFMHVVSHPINLVIVRALVMIPPLYYLGVSAETVLLFNVINNLQGLVSHCNVDLRAGWFNYLFVGTELHRYHHSAAIEESKNYAATLSIIDIVFGTFQYHPGRLPARLGVEQQEAYPKSNEFWRVMRLPFVGN